jgi:hypothetical protein
MDRRSRTGTEQEGTLYTREVAARLARISVEFLDQCAKEDLVRLQVMRGGGLGLSLRELRRLVRIRRLKEDLALDMPAIEIVLHMRRRMINLMRQLDKLERRMTRREEELMSEVRALQRRLSERYDWEKDEK